VVLLQGIFNLHADVLKNISPPAADDEIMDIKADESLFGKMGFLILKKLRTRLPI
jgi:hypothetical protein